MNFRVGQKVVCVDDAPSDGRRSTLPWDYRIQRGQVYVVRWKGIYNCSYGDTIYGVRLDGIERSPGLDTPYRSDRFRPLVTRKTSIEIFKRMLTPKTQSVTERDKVLLPTDDQTR